MILNLNICSDFEIRSLEDLRKLKTLKEMTGIKINKSAIARELNIDRRTVDKYNYQRESAQKLKEFIHTFKSIDGIIETYDYDLMKTVTDKMVVNADRTITVFFIGNQSIKVAI